MVDLTIIILTKNEEKNIEKCINSFGELPKRIVIIDSFSEDKTELVCNSFKTKYNLDFYKHEFNNHAEQLNWGLENSNIDTKWVLRIDADEELTKDLSQEISEKIPIIDEDVTGIFLNRRIYFMGRWIKHGGIYPQKVLRLFKHNKAYCEQKLMDEHICITEGSTLEFKYDFIDKNNKDLDWWINKHNWYSGRELLDYTGSNIFDSDGVKPSFFKGQVERKRWLKNIFYYKTPKLKRAKWFYLYRYIIRLGFLDGKEGLIYHFLQGYWYRFIVDAKIIEYENNKIRKE